MNFHEAMADVEIDDALKRGCVLCGRRASHFALFFPHASGGRLATPYATCGKHSPANPGMLARIEEAIISELRKANEARGDAGTRKRRPRRKGGSR